MRHVRVRDVRARPAVRDVALVGYAALAALCRPLTLLSAVAVALAAIALVAPAAHGQPPLRSVRRGWDAAPWVVLAMLLAAWEITAVLWGDDAAHPTLSLLLDPVLATYPGRVAGWLAWLGLGRWLVTR
jgi:hypothetical protein